MRTLREIIADLPAEDRAKVSARTQKLIAEEMALRHLRKTRNIDFYTIDASELAT